VTDPKVRQLIDTYFAAAEVAYRDGWTVWATATLGNARAALEAAIVSREEHERVQGEAAALREALEAAKSVAEFEGATACADGADAALTVHAGKELLQRYEAAMRIGGHLQRERTALLARLATAEAERDAERERAEHAENCEAHRRRITLAAEAGRAEAERERDQLRRRVDDAWARVEDLKLERDGWQRRSNEGDALAAALRAFERAAADAMAHVDILDGSTLSDPDSGTMADTIDGIRACLLTILRGKDRPGPFAFDALLKERDALKARVADLTALLVDIHEDGGAR
jgi:hypothetical protein